QLLGPHVQAVEEAGGLLLLGLFDVFLRQAALLGGHEDELLIIERNAQFLGQLFADGPAAGAVLSGNGDDGNAHGASPSWNWNPLPFKKPTRPRRSGAAWAF